MINFLLESTVSLIAFLAFYHLFLEREKMHQFNRFYLLFSIVISLIIPFISIEIIQEIENIPLATNFPIFIDSGNNIPKKETTNYTPILLWSLYIIITFVLLFRFLKNILYFKKTIQSNETVSYKNATLVLLNLETIPHTFLNYIFLNKESYNNRTIENELYEHELTHVNQNHSYDILCIELLKIIFWFNPVFYFYKKAIQLNHEFIADEKVVETHKNVSFYQSLLLNTNGNATYYLASNLNYLITKKRLIMMTKTTSKFSGFIKKAGIIPLLILMIYFLCTDLVAQERIVKTETNEINKNSNNSLDTVKKKKHSRNEIKHSEKLDNKNEKKEIKTGLTSKEEIENAKNQVVNSLDEFNTDGKENGYIYMDNATYFFNKNEKGEIEYFNRWGNSVNVNGEKLNSDVNYKSIKISPKSLEKNEKAKKNIVKNLDDFDIGEMESGYIYMENGTYFFIKNEKGETEYYNRWGNRVNEKGEKLAETTEKK